MALSIARPAIAIDTSPPETTPAAVEVQPLPSPPPTVPVSAISAPVIPAVVLPPPVQQATSVTAQQALAQARERVSQIFSVSPDQAKGWIGLAPSQLRNSDLVRTLRVISVLMPKGLRQKIFVVTEDDNQARQLRERGFIAQSDLGLLVTDLIEKRGDTPVAVALRYLAEGSEQDHLQDAIDIYGAGERLTLVRLESAARLRGFLQGLLAMLRGIELHQVGQTDLDQLTADVELLIRA